MVAFAAESGPSFGVEELLGALRHTLSDERAAWLASVCREVGRSPAGVVSAVVEGLALVHDPCEFERRVSLVLDVVGPDDDGSRYPESWRTPERVLRRLTKAAAVLDLSDLVLLVRMVECYAFWFTSRRADRPLSV